MPGVDMTSDVKSGQQIFLGLHDVFCPLCIGRAGASKTRRLILLISVGWLPPSLHPSGACLGLGSRVCCSLITPTRVAPHWGCASADGGSKRWHTRCRAKRCSRSLGGHRPLVRHGPHQGTQFPGDGHDDPMRVFAACAQVSLAFAQPHLRFPTDVLEGFGQLFHAQLKMPADFGGVPVGPSAFDEGAARMGVANATVTPGKATPQSWSASKLPDHGSLDDPRRDRQPSRPTPTCGSEYY